MSAAPSAGSQVITYHMTDDGRIARVERPRVLREDIPVTIRLVNPDGALVREISSGDVTVEQARRELADRKRNTSGKFSPDVAEQILRFKEARPDAYRTLVEKLGLPENPHEDAFDFSALDRTKK